MYCVLNVFIISATVFNLICMMVISFMFCSIILCRQCKSCKSCKSCSLYTKFASYCHTGYICVLDLELLGINVFLLFVDLSICFNVYNQDSI